MPPSDAKQVAEELREMRETMLVTLGNKDRPGVLLTKLDTLIEKVDNLHVLCHGEPKEPDKGLVFRLGQIEHKYATWSKVLWASVVAMIGVVAKGVWDFFSKS